jgi:hypothetical protein
MVNTLRITSVAAMILAALVLVSVLGPWRLVNLGMKSDPRLDRILAEPNAVDRSKAGSAGKTADNADQVSPLVKQATIFAKIIRGSEPVQPPPIRPGDAKKTEIVVPPMPAKFTVIGLSYSATRPEESFAYVRMEDNAVQWVRKGDVIGHSTVQEIRSGSIVCSSGGRENEMMVTAPPKTASLLETPTGALPAGETPAATDKPVAGAVARPGRGDDEALSRAAEDAREIQRTGDNGDPNEMFRKREAVMRQLALGLRSSRSGPGPESNEPRGTPQASPKRSGYRSSVIAPPPKRGN